MLSRTMWPTPTLITLLLTYPFLLSVTAQTSSLINVDDTDTRLQYSAPGLVNWIASTNPPSRSLFQNTDHHSNATNATVALSGFSGPLIQYWGTRDPSHGSCIITIDGEDVGAVNSNGRASPPVLLFERTNLNPQMNHTIIIKVANETFPNTCELDRFVYSIGLFAATAVSSNTLSTTSQNASSQSSSSSHEALVIGLAAGLGGGVLLLILIGIVIWLLRRGRGAPNFVLEDPTPQSSPAIGSGKAENLATFSDSSPRSPRSPRPLSIATHDRPDSRTETTDVEISETLHGGPWHLVETPRTPDALPSSIGSHQNLFAGVAPLSPIGVALSPPSSPQPIRPPGAGQSSPYDRPMSNLSEVEVDRIAESLASRFRPGRGSPSPPPSGSTSPRTRRNSAPSTRKSNPTRTNRPRPSYEAY